MKIRILKQNLLKVPSLFVGYVRLFSHETVARFKISVLVACQLYAVMLNGSKKCDTWLGIKWPRLCGNPLDLH